MLRRASLVIGFVCLLALAPPADAQTTAFFYTAQSGSPLASGQTATITSTDATFTPNAGGPLVEFFINGPAVGDNSVTFAGTGPGPLTVGTYESATRLPAVFFNSLDVSIRSTECNYVTGRFVVLEVNYAGDGSVLQFAADFEEHCDAATPAVFGAVRYNSTISSLTPFGGQYPSYSLQMGSVTHGTVTGGGLSCGTAGTSCQISLSSPATVQLMATPDAGYMFTGWTGDCDGVITTSIIVYGPRVCGATFDTIVPTAPRTILFWNSAAGEYIGQGHSDIYTQANAQWSLFSGGEGITPSSVEIQITGMIGARTVTWTLQFGAPFGSPLQAGMTYTGATRIPGLSMPLIEIDGDGRACNTNSGQFTVRDVEFDSNRSVTKLNLDFEMHCTQPTLPSLTGSIAYNSAIEIPPPPTVSIDKTQLNFAATLSAGAFTAQTDAQMIRMTQSGTGTVSWTAQSNQPWLVVSPVSGSGSATLSITVQFVGGLAASQTGSITINLTGATNSIGPISATLTTETSVAAAAPFGSFDTPTNGSTGLAGSIAVTGWALDDVEVTRVTVCRDAVMGENPPADSNCAGNAKIYVGDAVFVDGARPDVQAINSTLPLSSRAGWGYLLLTNFLPALGNGTFRLYAFAFDADGHASQLGTKTITCDNADSTAPFGAIDTPGQGAIVSGVVANFGWVLSPGMRHSDPPDGGSVTVFVDGAPVGSPGGWTSRSDLSTLFPIAQYSGVDSALGVFGLDTTTLTNGLHTISWAVTDTLGMTSGVGSRFFTVSNGSDVLALADARSNVAQTSRPAINEVTAGTILLGHVGFGLNSPLEYFFPDADGVVTINARELDRIELQLEPGATGVTITPKGDKHLPAGARIDAATGRFTWAPGPGFIGRYDFVLGGHRVRVVLHPKD